MKEHIERAALKERFQKRLIWLKKDVHDEYSKGLYHGCETDMGLIDEILAADVVEVRHGRWLDKGWDGDFSWQIDGRGSCWRVYECSKCQCKTSAKTDYCPNCGARMDKEDEHEIS